MPVKLDSKLPSDNADARIELVPLIDIMFFLLASFTLVSLSMVNMKSVKVNLPTATSASADLKKDFVDISIDKSGSAYLDKKPVASNELTAALAQLSRTNPKLRVFISGDRDTHNGDMIHVLDLVRRAGIDKVAFEVKAADRGGAR